MTARPVLGLVVLAAALMAAGCGGDEDVRAVANVRSPEPVEGLQAAPADGRVRLTWQAGREADLVGYQIYRAPDRTGPYLLVGATGTAAAPWFEDTGGDQDGNQRADGLRNGAKLFYKVVALDREGFSGHLHLASVAEATPIPEDTDLADLQVVGIGVYEGEDHVLLTWPPIARSDLLGYRIYREDLQQPGQPVELGMVGIGRNHFTDLEVAQGEDYAYLVVPVSRDRIDRAPERCEPAADGTFPTCRQGIEGRSQRSRNVTLMVPDRSVPLAPGHDLAIGTVEAVFQGASGVSLAWGRPIQNTDGSFFATETAADELIGGGYIVYRALAGRGPFEPIAILPELGSETTSTYTDPAGTATSVYLVRAFDRFGTLGDESRRVSPGFPYPDLVRGVDAFASDSAGTIRVVWNPEPEAAGGYRIFRSRFRDRAFSALADVPPTASFYSDGTESLEIGGTYWYRVAPLSNDQDGVRIQGALSAPAVAVPGPSSGVFYLEAEDARVAIAGGSEAAFARIFRMGFHDGFSADGARVFETTPGVVPGTTTVTLRWTEDLATDGSATPDFRRYEAFLLAVRDDRSPRLDALLQAEGSLAGAAAGDGRLGLDLHTTQFGTPPVPTMFSLGDIVFEDQNRGFGVPTPETIALTFTWQDPNPLLVGDGVLVVDGVLLVRR